MWTATTSQDFPNAHIVTAHFSDHRVDVFIPSDVTTESPMLVMHDGRNVFFPEYSTQGISWGILDLVTEKNFTSGRTPVVVSVWGTEAPIPGARYFELAPENLVASDKSLWGSLLTRADIAPAPLTGNHYHSIIVNEILPAVSALTGVVNERERTALCGSSMGGVTSIYGASLYPDVYGTVLSLSTHWAFWSDGFIEQVIQQIAAVQHPRIWIDRGDLDLDSNYIGLHEQADELFQSFGWQQGSEYQARVFAGTGHNEQAWAQRLPEVLRWWLGEK